MFAATVMPLGPLAWWLMAVSNEQWMTCTAAHPGADEQGFSGPCGRNLTLGTVALLVLVAMASSILVGILLGLGDGRLRVRFAHGRWVSALIVTVTGPATMLAYAVGYLAGRLLPTPRRRERPVDLTYRHGWETAVRLYTSLVTGHPPPSVLAPGFLTTEPVYLDAPFTYSRYYGMDVSFAPGRTFAFGSPAFVAGAVVGDMIGNSIGRARAAGMSRTQWREHRTVRVVVTRSTTWCCVDGRWLAFDHAAVMEYHLQGSACLLSFTDVEPLMLAGPSAACHAVTFAYLRGGDWPRMSFLHPIAAAARLP